MATRPSLSDRAVAFTEPHLVSAQFAPGQLRRRKGSRWRPAMSGRTRRTGLRLGQEGVATSSNRVRSECVRVSATVNARDTTRSDHEIQTAGITHVARLTSGWVATVGTRIPASRRAYRLSQSTLCRMAAGCSGARLSLTRGSGFGPSSQEKETEDGVSVRIVVRRQAPCLSASTVWSDDAVTNFTPITLR